MSGAKMAMISMEKMATAEIAPRGLDLAMAQAARSVLRALLGRRPATSRAAMVWRSCAISFPYYW